MKRAISVFLTLAIVFTLPAYAFAMSESEWNEYWQSSQKSAAVYVSPGHSESERYFTWYGKSGGEGTVLLKGKTGERTFSASAQETTQGDYIYKVYAHDLDEGEYSYVCKSDGFESTESTLLVSDKTSFSALYVTDVHMTKSNGEEALRSYSFEFGNTVQKAKDEYGASLILSAGDQASQGLREEYEAFVSPPALKGMETALSIGNHDRKGTEYKTFATFPYEGYAGIKSYVGRDWWFVKGNVLFLMIDSNCPDAAAHRCFMQSAVLKNSGVKWRVAVMHHDLFGGRLPHREGENALLRLLYVPLMDEFDVDLVLAGHSHYYTRSDVIMGGFSTVKTKVLSSVKNANGTLYLTSGSFTANTRVSENSEDAPVGNRVGFDYLTGEGIFNILDFSEDSIRLRSFTVSKPDEPFTEFTLEKTESRFPVSLPPMPIFNTFARSLSTFVAFTNNLATANDLKESGFDIDLRQAVFGCDA